MTGAKVCKMHSVLGLLNSPVQFFSLLNLITVLKQPETVMVTVNIDRTFPTFTITGANLKLLSDYC